MQNFSTDFSKFDEFNFITNNDNVKDTEHLTCKKWGDNYKIINYKKDQLGKYYENDHVVFRSVILNKDNQIVCVSPYKSCLLNEFEYHNIEFWGEEFVEGTMINLFFDSALDTWEIATRGAIGGHNKFYSESPMNFRDMFFDACKQNGLDNFDHLPKNFCYSFVLQHPLNNIVQYNRMPHLYVVEVFEILENGRKSQAVDFRRMKMFPRAIRYPRLFPSKSTNDLKERFAGEKTPFTVMGVVLRNCLGQRSKIRNPAYEVAKQLRGNEPVLFYQYLDLLKNKKLKEFLKYFPHFRNAFNQFQSDIWMTASEISQYYHDCFVKKTKPLKEYENPYKYIMYNLHELYKTILRPEGKAITPQWVLHEILLYEPKVLRSCVAKMLKDVKEG
jgi:hypothetical protein